MPEFGPSSGRGEVYGSQGQRVEVGIFGEMNVAELQDHVSLHFGYGYADVDIYAIAVGDGAVTAGNRTLVLTGNTGSAGFETRRRVLYRPGHTVLAGGTAAFSGAGEGTIGLYNDDDGFRWGVDLATGIPFFEMEFDGTVVRETSSTGPDLTAFDWSKLNIWRVKYGYYGVAACVFELLVPGTMTWLTAHIFATHGTIAHPHSFPNLPMRADAEAGCVLTTASIEAGTFGGTSEVGYRQFAVDGRATVGDTNTETAVAVFKSVSVFNGEINGVLCRMLKNSYSSDLEGEGIVRIYSNATLTGTPTWVDIDAGDSVIQQATVASAVPTVGTGKLMDVQHFATGNLGVGASISGGNASFQHVDVWGGENVVVTVQRLSGTTAYSLGYGFSWREYH